MNAVSVTLLTQFFHALHFLLVYPICAQKIAAPELILQILPFPLSGDTFFIFVAGQEIFFFFNLIVSK